MLKRLVPAFLFFFMTACMPSPHKYEGKTPRFQPEKFFNGNLISYGTFQDFKGKEQLHFTTRTKASWQGDKGEMHEYFTYSDGTKRERHWQFTKIDNHHVIGTAPDVVGEAKGEFYGNAMHWVYKIKLPRGKNKDGIEKTITVKFDDWLYMVDENHMFSLIRISKYGFPVGRLTMFFEKNNKI